VQDGPVIRFALAHCLRDRLTIHEGTSRKMNSRSTPYSHFVWELPRKLLRPFPVMLQFDKRRRFIGLAIFKPQNKLAGGRQRPCP